MQFHHHGYVSSDPRLLPAAGIGVNRASELPDEVDVLIVGSGPAGMITAAQLAQYPDVNVRIIDRRPGRLTIGQADGIQARSVETFQAFGFAESITQEAYSITAMNFWAPESGNPARIHRTSRTPDDPHNISEFPHLIVNQARVLDYFAKAAADAPGRVVPDYGYEFVTLTRDDSQEYPLQVALNDSHVNPVESVVRTIRAKYVVGCDGARSPVRESIGLSLDGKAALHAWGVIDVLAVTDFPDWRTKCAIQSEAGSILLIPREGGHLVRLYVDLGDTEDTSGSVRGTPLEDIVKQAQEILRPYKFEAREVSWWSVYEVGHRLTSAFDDSTGNSDAPVEPRVFIAGDACHTHSAKAGQGMNVSMQDGWNIAWKLGQVLSGRSSKSLLETYNSERLVIAQNLIDFDREWSSMMAKKPEERESPEELGRFYVETAEFPAGFRTCYEPSMITRDGTNQELASGYPIGKRFHSSQVVRVSDANQVHLGHHHRADGRWRFYAFADQVASGANPTLDAFAEWLTKDTESPVVKYTRNREDVDAVFDVKAVYPQVYTAVDLNQVPRIFLPAVGPLGLTDYEKVYATNDEVNIFAERGVSSNGAIVLVRPDHYVAGIFALTDTTALAEFCAGIFATNN